MGNAAASRITVVGLVAAALGCTGCSLIGAGVGAAVDGKRNRAARPTYMQGFEITNVKPGSSVTLVLAGGERIAGRYDGLESAAAEYGPRYARGRAGVHELTLPELGERVIVAPLSGDPLPAVFAGFDSGRVIVQLDGQGGTVRFALRRLASLTAKDGTVLPGPRLEALVADRRVPLLSRIALGRWRVPLEQVKSVEFRPRSHKGPITGFVVGAMIDVIVVAAAIDSLNGSWGGDWCGTGNCSLLLGPDARRR